MQHHDEHVHHRMQRGTGLQRRLLLDPERKLERHVRPGHRERQVRVGGRVQQLQQLVHPGADLRVADVRLHLVESVQGGFGLRIA
jgi:hypothetical protein